MVTVASGRPFFQQDGAPAHTSLLSKAGWPITWTCFDLSTAAFECPRLLYYVWSVVELVGNKTRRDPNVTSLRIATEAAFSNIESALHSAHKRA